MAIKPGKYNPQQPDIELIDSKSKKRFGLKLDGIGALQVGTISQDDSVHIRNAGKRVGDFDEQRSWKGGRGVEDLSNNAEGFWDAQNAWTLSDGRVHQTLLWQVASGLRNVWYSLPDNTHSLTWRPLLSSSLYLSMSFVGANFAADYARMWIRRVGTPGTLTITLNSDSAGIPGTVLKTVTITTSDITDWISVFQLIDWTTTQTLSPATTYHIVAYGAAADNKNNHWEIGGYNGGSSGLQSADGVTYAASGINPYYYIADADINRKWFSFFLDGAMYVVDKKDDGTTASKLYINGDRGKATSSISNVLTDTTKAWGTNDWIGARLKIIRGTGAGQTKEILSNNGSQIAVTSDFTTIPDSTSEYIIYATQRFTELTTTGLGVVTGQPLVVNQIVYFPHGAAALIRRMVWNPATPGHSYSNDTGNYATFLAQSVSASGVQIWKALNNTGSGGATTVAVAPATVWASSPAVLSFATAVTIGDASSPITGMCEKDYYVYIFKEDGVWTVDQSSRITKLQSGIEKVPSSETGVASIAHQQFVYYSWLHSLIRVYGSSHDDVGQDWSGYGLPDGREGSFSSLDSYTSLLMAAVDAGTGTSSVLGWDGIGWHEIIRGYAANKRIRMVKVQPCQDTRNRTWFDVGGDLIFQEMPYKKGSPRLDTGTRYMHEAVIESAAIDMGTASALPKFIKELVVYCENLGDGNEIYVDYQVDDDVHTSTWTHATVLYESPESVAFLGLSNIRKFAYRLRICSSNNTTPVQVLGVVPNGYARTPYKMVWTVRCRADNITARGRFVKPDVLMRWLLDNARFPGRIEMRSQFELAHKFYVIIHPPRMFPYKPAQNGQSEESMFTIVLEEA